MANVLACCQGVVVDIMATMFDVFFSRQSVVWTVSRFLACLSTLWRGASRLHPRFQLQLLHVQWTTCEGSELELENICSTQRIPPHDLDFSERIHSWVELSGSCCRVRAYHLHDLWHRSWVEFILYRSCTISYNGRLGSRRSGSWSVWSVRRVKGLLGGQQ